MAIRLDLDEQAVRPDGASCDRREEILDAATALFARQGYSDAVTQDLAAKLGIGKGTLYRHFPSKRELFLAAVDRVMARLRGRIDEHVAGAVDPVDRIVRGVESFLGFFAENPDFVEMLLLERAQFRDAATSTLTQHRAFNRSRWREIYRAMIDDGLLRDIPPERITVIISELLYGTIFTNQFAGSHRTAAEQARDVLDVLFFGILSRSEQIKRCPGPGGPGMPAPGASAGDQHDPRPRGGAIA